MNEFWAALVGTVVGGLVSAMTAWRVLVSERKSRVLERQAERRVLATQTFVRDLLDLHDCVMNPSRNLERMAAVESAASSSLVVLAATMDLPRERAIGDFAEKVLQAVRFASAIGSVWGDAAVVRKSAGAPFVRWSVGDPSFTEAWFATQTALSDAEFKQTTAVFDASEALTKR